LESGGQIDVIYTDREKAFDKVINAHSVDDIDLEHVQHIKDLGITFDVELNFSLHTSEKVNRAN